MLAVVDGVAEGIDVVDSDADEDTDDVNDEDADEDEDSEGEGVGVKEGVTDNDEVVVAVDENDDVDFEEKVEALEATDERVLNFVLADDFVDVRVPADVRVLKEV